MADLNNPLSNQGYLALLASIVENNQAALTLLEGVVPLTNLPALSKRWNAASARFEVWDGVSVWAELTALYEIKVRNADQLNGQTDAFYRNAGNLNAGVIPAGQFNDTAHGVRGGGLLHALANGVTAGFMPPFEFNKLAGIEAGATADMTASEILAALITVDGFGSGLDADLLDSNHASSFHLKADNLSGLANLVAARNNLGLKSLAIQDVIDVTDMGVASVVNSALGALAVTESKISKTIGSTGSTLVDIFTTWTPAAGFYDFTQTPTFTLGIASAELFVNGAWQSGINQAGGLMWFDGANMRIYESSSNGSCQLYWQKLG